MQAQLTQMLAEYQPNAVGFGGFGIMPSPARWDGTEDGHPPYPLWSTGTSYPGDPTSPYWNPAAVDTTLQLFDQWFFVAGDPVHSLLDLIEVYHHSVGQNGVLEMDFAIDKNGQVSPFHAARYKEFGDWIRSCYGAPLASTSGSGTEFTVYLDAASPPIDRYMIQEDQSFGQRIREYIVEYQMPERTGWIHWYNGTR